MDPATASIIAAIISAAASVAVAVITTRARIGPSPTVDSPASASPAQSAQRHSFRTFRAVGWVLVGFLYLVAAAMILTGFAGYYSVHQGLSPAGDLKLATGILLFGVIFAAIGFWAQKRLRPGAN
jgi:ABC-type multidrug transport system fused ATPase/permease subunit